MMSLFVSVLALLFGVASGLTREYIPVPINKTWTDAQKYCKKNYSDLATITNDEENKRIYALVGKSGGSWIGLYRDQIDENIWLWSDKTQSSFFPWNSTQPNNYNGNQDCGELIQHGWNDYFCYLEQEFVCHQNLVLVKENMTWEQALQYCKRKFTGLACPASAAQIQLAEMESSQAQTDSVWTGLRFVHGRWLWTNKEPLGNRTVSLPSCPLPQYRCGARNITAHVWENRNCNEKLNFLCYY